MSLLGVGERCHTCALVDFLPFKCPACSHIFCRDHVQTHSCDAEPVEAGPSRKRVRGTCAYGGCSAETIESIGGYEGPSEDNIVREIRCVCGGAYCIAHRSQEAHECTAPRALSARHDAVLERRERAKEAMGKHFPEQAARERVTMPKQVDRTRTGSPPRKGAEAPPSSSSDQPPAAATESQPPPAKPSADDKLYKMHTTKVRSLAKPLDPKASRDACAAVEWVVSDPERVRQWAAAQGKYAPSNAAAALSTAKPGRALVPNDMPIGKLFDVLVSQAKLSRAGKPLSLLAISLKPGTPRTPAVLDLTRSAGEHVSTGDILVLVRAWE